MLVPLIPVIRGFEEFL